jgi:hypothetical protein
MHINISSKNRYCYFFLICLVASSRWSRRVRGSPNPSEIHRALLPQDTLFKNQQLQPKEVKKIEAASPEMNVVINTILKLFLNFLDYSCLKIAEHFQYQRH